MFNKIYLYTAPIIYYLESYPKYVDVMQNFLLDNYEYGGFFYTSIITELEYLPTPLRNQRSDLVNAFSNFKDILNISAIDVKPTIIKIAIELAVKYKSLKALDAIHIASAISENCDVFLSNDKALKQITDTNVLLAEELLQ